MRNSPYTIHLELTPLPVAPVKYCSASSSARAQRWEQPAITHDMRIADRKSDLTAANKSGNRFLKSAAFKALNNLKKIGG